MFCAEDTPDDTVVPRLKAHGADLKRIRLVSGIGTTDPETGRKISRGVRLDMDIEQVRRHLQRFPGTRLLTFDPISEYLGKTDSHKNAEVRTVLAPLTAMAAEFGIAIVSVTHFNKGGIGPALYRAMGSLAFVAQARAAWAFVRDADDEDRVLFLPLKNNLAKRMPGLAYGITDAGINWEEGDVDISADDAFANLDDAKRSGNKLDKALAWLKQRLADGKEVESDALCTEAKAARIAFATYKRAREEICSSRKGAKWEGGKWFVKLQDEHLAPVEHRELLERLEPHEEAQQVQQAQEAQEAQEAQLSLLREERYF